MKIIGFVGSICSGKTTAASYSAEQFGGTVLSLASPLKLIFEEFPEFKNSHRRDTLVKLGETMKRYMGNQIFAEAVIRKSMNALSQSIPVFIDDVRFPYEAQAIINSGGEVFYIQSETENMFLRYMQRSRDGDTLKTAEDFTNYLFECPSERYAALIKREGDTSFIIIKNDESITKFYSRLDYEILGALNGFVPNM